jgi:hypothetical protein
MTTDFSNFIYTPVLKWKQGEYQALMRLNDDTKSYVLPLIEIPPIGWDFEKQKLAKTLDEHMEPFARRVDAKWPKRPIFVDCGLLDPDGMMATGQHPLQYSISSAIERGSTAIPVTDFERPSAYQSAVNVCLSELETGLCIRIRMDQLVSPDLSSRISSLITGLGADIENLHLVIDIGSPEFNPLNDLASALKSRLGIISNLYPWRTYTLAATSFPESMAPLETGAQIIPRYEWLLYKHYLSILSPSDRVPNFGDYAISHPVAPEGDMRLLQPSASVRYTVNDGWYIVKGMNVRKYKFDQYRSLCRLVVSSPHFYGSGYSEGDAYVLGCSQGSVSTGTLTTWRWVGVNHHITKVVNDLASLSAA